MEGNTLGLRQTKRGIWPRKETTERILMGKKTVSEIHVAQRILLMALVWSSSALVVLA